MDYGEFVRGCHLGVFPSYYEPWGYTPGKIIHFPWLSFVVCHSQTLVGQSLNQVTNPKLRTGFSPLWVLSLVLKSQLWLNARKKLFLFCLFFPQISLSQYLFQSVTAECNLKTSICCTDYEYNSFKRKYDIIIDLKGIRRSEGDAFVVGDCPLLVSKLSFIILIFSFRY